MLFILIFNYFEIITVVVFKLINIQLILSKLSEYYTYLFKI